MSVLLFLFCYLCASILATGQHRNEAAWINEFRGDDASKSENQLETVLLEHRSRTGYSRESLITNPGPIATELIVSGHPAGKSESVGASTAEFEHTLTKPNDSSILSGDTREENQPIFYAAMSDDSICANGRNWSQKRFEPMRIKAFFLESIDKQSQSDSDFIKNAMNRTTRFFEGLLKVRRANAPIGIEKNSCSSAATEEFPNHFRNTSGQCDQKAEGGVSDADFIVYVSADQTSSCKGGALAHAGACSLNPFDRRPVAGTVNVCPDKVRAKTWNIDATISTLRHELLHALGFVQRYFGCPHLEGAELENEGSDGTKEQHWEKRLFGPETMTGILSRRSYLSNLTLFLMEDSGWYQPNYSLAEDLSYGKNAGCTFAMGSCSEYINAQPMKLAGADPFCNWADYTERIKLNASTVRRCSKNREYIVFCDWKEEDKSEADPKHKYFDDMEKGKATNVMGRNYLNDGCPTWSEAYYGDQEHGSDRRHGDSVCTNTDTQPSARANWGAEMYGTNSTCIEQEGKFEVFQCGIVGAIIPSFETAHGAGCYKYKCDKGRLFIQANYSYSDSDPREVHTRAWKPCFGEGSRIFIRRQQRSGRNFTWRYHKGTLICPSCEKICENNAKYPDFKCKGNVQLDSTDLSKDPCGIGVRSSAPTWLILTGVCIVIFVSA